MTIMKALLADDEPFYLEWLDDYLASKGIEVDYAANVDDAVFLVKSVQYRLIVVDLNLPLLSDGRRFATTVTLAYDSYPGLYIANAARNAGYRTKQVIIYSVFGSREIEEAASKLYCTYLTKTHPGDLRKEIDYVLSYDPSQ
jgi:CheY-like chemotaxis protein